MTALNNRKEIRRSLGARAAHEQADNNENLPKAQTTHMTRHGFPPFGPCCQKRAPVIYPVFIFEALHVVKVSTDYRRHGATTFAPTSFSRRWNSGEAIDDRTRRGAQPIDGLGRQHERRRLPIQIVEFGLVLQRRERHVDRVNLGVRDPQRGRDRGSLLAFIGGRVSNQPQGLPTRRRVPQQFDVS